MKMKITEEILWKESIFDIELPESDNEAILDFYEKKVKETKGVQKSNIGGWQKEIKPGECKEYDDVLHLINLGVQDIFKTQYRVNIKTKVSNSWLNSNEMGESNAFHTHPGSLFSGVYYVNASKHKQNGHINFVNTNHHVIEEYKHLMSNNLGADREETFAMGDHHESMRSHCSMPPNIGHAYVFPPWVGHEVRRNPHEFNRLVIGMNFIVA